MKILSMPAAGGANVNMIYDNGDANPLYLPFHQYHYSGANPTVTYGASSIDVSFSAIGHEFFFTLQKIDLTDASAIVLEYDNDNALTTAGIHCFSPAFSTKFKINYLKSDGPLKHGCEC